MKTTIMLFAAGLLLTGTGSILAGMHYVDVNSTNATPPYSSWATAATNIQDAVDAAAAGDEIVVTNRIYAPIGVPGLLTVRSVNGPQFTIIDGGGGDRCALVWRPAVRRHQRMGQFASAIQLALHQCRRQCLHIRGPRPRRQSAHRGRYGGH